MNQRLNFARDFDDLARDLVRDLHEARPRVFWADMLFTALVAWGAFYAAVAFASSLAVLAAAVAVATLAFYRGLCFIHELTHVRPKSLPGFETTWNLLFGVPLLLPSFVYVGVHQDHHKISTYGTSADPEYMPFAQTNFMPVVFIAHSVLIPVFLFLRFILVSPFALVLPPLHRWLAEHASALSMNVTYSRAVNRALLSRMRSWELVILAFWGAGFAYMFAGLLPWRTLAVWYTIAASVCVVNTLRTLGAHRYESHGAPLDRAGQLSDSIDTPGAVWTEFWAPVGLRYHALHHYFPGIPYHNLPEAHRRLIAALPPEAPYVGTVSRGLWYSLGRLYITGHQARSTRSHRPT